MRVCIARVYIFSYICVCDVCMYVCRSSMQKQSASLSTYVPKCVCMYCFVYVRTFVCLKKRYVETILSFLHHLCVQIFVY